MKLQKIAPFFLLFVLFLFTAAFAQVESNGNNPQGQQGQTQNDNQNNGSNGVDFDQMFNQDDSSSDIRPFELVPSNPNQSTPFQTMQGYEGQQSQSRGQISMPAKDLSAVNPATYSLQPGDTVVVRLWTPQSLVEQGVVSPTGTISLLSLGEIKVQGVTLNHLSSCIQGALQKYYKHVTVAANLTDVRTMKIRILGDVTNPGFYTVSGITGVMDALQAAGGLTKTASVRDIQLQETGNGLVHLDYFKWVTFGDQNQDPYLEPNEVIFVPPVHDQVDIEGEVKHPGTYEMLAGETYADLIRMAGGYTSQAEQSQTKISRISGPASQSNLSVTDTLAMQNGDEIYVPPMSLFQQKIRVVGEVVGTDLFSPVKSNVTGQQSIERMGWYRLHDDEKVGDVVLDLGGFTPEADPSHAWIERKNPDGSKQIIRIDFHKLFALHDESQNVTLKDGDTLFIPPSPNSIYVVGDVRSPGVFPFTPGNGLQDYVTLAGGPTDHGVITHVKLVRETGGGAKPVVMDVNLKAFLVGDTVVKLPLIEPGDVIYVPHTAVASIQDIFGWLGNIFLIKELVP